MRAKELRLDYKINSFLRYEMKKCEKCGERSKSNHPQSHCTIHLPCITLTKLGFCFIFQWTGEQCETDPYTNSRIQRVGKILTLDVIPIYHISGDKRTSSELISASIKHLLE